VKVADHFLFYATQFPTVEINLTFYRLPTEAMVKGWRKKAPPEFIYAIKGSRFITHMKKLVNLDGAVEKFFDRIKPMREVIGPILWQLPPFLKKDVPRLDDFLALLPRTYPYAVEFRHPSWMEDEVLETLKKHKVALVSLSSLAMPIRFELTTNWTYIRFHGLEGGAAHNYTKKELEPWASHIREQSANRRLVYAYFNNDANVRAPANAHMLMEMTGSSAVRAFAKAA
jgi:uncharacterized protein YecE (DUF72 family)